MWNVCVSLFEWCIVDVSTIVATAVVSISLYFSYAYFDFYYGSSSGDTVWSHTHHRDVKERPADLCAEEKPKKKKKEKKHIWHAYRASSGRCAEKVGNYQSRKDLILI